MLRKTLFGTLMVTAFFVQAEEASQSLVEYGVVTSTLAKTIYIGDENYKITLSTLVGETASNPSDAYINSKIVFTKGDEVLFLTGDKNNELQYIYRLVQ